MVKWSADNSMKADGNKFQWIILPGSWNDTHVQVPLGDIDIAFVQKIFVLVCIEMDTWFYWTCLSYWSKSSAQISALQSGSNFNYCPLAILWFLTTRESINKIGKIQKRAFRFVLQDLISNYNDLLLESGFHSFRIFAVKSLMIELFKILEGMAPTSLSELFRMEVGRSSVAVLAGFSSLVAFVVHYSDLD